MFLEGDIGVLPLLGVFDLFGLIEICDMCCYEIMEVKHGRVAMLGFLYVILIEVGICISIDDCVVAPAGLIVLLEAVLIVGWLQIMLTTCMFEMGNFLLVKVQDDGEVGDIANILWVCYDDLEMKMFKLNVEC